MAQLVERLIYTEKVRGSNPLGSTVLYNKYLAEVANVVKARV